MLHIFQCLSFWISEGFSCLFPVLLSCLGLHLFLPFLHYLMFFVPCQPWVYLHLYYNAVLYCYLSCFYCNFWNLQVSLISFRSWDLLLCHSSTSITSCCNMIMHGPILQGAVQSLKHPRSGMASIFTGHITHWEWLGFSWTVYATACSSSCEYSATSHSYWIGVDQHYTAHDQHPDQLYATEMRCTAWCKWWPHDILTWVLPPVR